MSGNAYWNPVTNPDKSRRLERIEWPSRKSLLEPDQETGYVRFF
jgi:hypothetical protein